MPPAHPYWSLPYPSRREPVIGDAAVATSQPLAVQAGMGLLQRGGNAVDAALAAAMALAVVEPTSNGVGGDLFAMVWDGAHLHALNASGRAPLAIDAERLQAQDQMPALGWDSVTVPGAVSGWVALADRFGTRPLADLVAPAVAYAENGYPVGPVTARAWADAARTLGGLEDFRPFLPGGSPPVAGQRFAFPALASTLREIADTGGESFYRGRLAEAIAAHAAGAGGALTVDDLDRHRADWVDPVHTAFGGLDVHEMPPNTQGVAALEALALLRRTAVSDADVDSADATHLQIEATKLALADSHATVADPDAMPVTATEMLADRWLRRRVAGITDGAADVAGAAPRPGGTVYVCAADGDGRMVSLIQSNYTGFGSGVVVPGTGIALHNRGAGFVTAPAHPNVVAPGKRPFHTTIPALTTRDGRADMAFGVMGGFMQAQGHVQMVVRTALWGQNPQAAADAPRWRVMGGRQVLVEEGMPATVVQDLVSRGHDVRTGPPATFGGAQAIQVLDSGCYVGASDWRKEGLAAVV